MEAKRESRVQRREGVICVQFPVNMIKMRETAKKASKLFSRKLLQASSQRDNLSHS